MFAHLKTDADRLAADAAWSRQERNTHARRGYEILQRRIGSPPGLVLCFGTGVFAGARPRRRRIPEGGDHYRHDRTEDGLARWLLHGPLAAAAIKLGTAYLAGALIHPDPEPPPPFT